MRMTIIFLPFNLKDDNCWKNKLEESSSFMFVNFLKLEFKSKMKDSSPLSLSLSLPVNASEQLRHLLIFEENIY